MIISIANPLPQCHLDNHETHIKSSWNELESHIRLNVIFQYLLDLSNGIFLQIFLQKFNV
jgi:hypothetical protein